ncbi:ABC transporter substrate-binding protein [Acidisphaera sp. L21]|uniref:ABC transporter substrate-binding protein n=1 Tax=Acidisphaera sp. L21 TaxID=1641851 RepID=UPI00131A63C1|nr:ABC transporter substrate-binding protein [Acidisphaera sp. L21]
MNASHPSRRTLLGGIAASAALPLVAGAQPAPLQGTPKRGGVLKISVAQRTASLNPLQISGPSEYIAADMLFSSLLRMSPSMKADPDLATEFTADAAAKVFTFRLRPNVTFHDGTPLTADDVVATYKAILNPKTLAPSRAAMGSLQEIEAVDPLTVRFTCAKPFADFPVATAHANAKIVSAVALRDLPGMATKANGTGPFKQDVFDSTRLLRVVRNPAYFTPGFPYLDAVELPLFPDLTAEVQNLLSGTTDIMADVQQADYKRIAAAPGIVAQRVKSGRFANIVMRMDTRPFNDIRVRNALAMAIDRDTLVDLVLEGLGQSAGDNAISPQYQFYSDTQAATYDPVAAKKLLAEAGYPNGLKIPLICSNRPAIRSAVGVAMKEMTRDAGFDIDVQTIPHDTYLANVWMKGNFYVGYWGMQATEDAAFTLLFTSSAAFADTAWNNKEFDDLVAEGASTVDANARRAIYAKAQALMVRDKPSLIPFFQDVLTASRDRVKGWTQGPLQRSFFIERVWLA